MCNAAIYAFYWSTKLILVVKYNFGLRLRFWKREKEGIYCLCLWYVFARYFITQDHSKTSICLGTSKRLSENWKNQLDSKIFFKQPHSILFAKLIADCEVWLLIIYTLFRNITSKNMKYIWKSITVRSCIFNHRTLELNVYLKITVLRKFFCLKKLKFCCTHKIRLMH